MQCKATSSTRLFFKHSSEIKGPFTERQVHEWYRLRIFENSCLFYFVKPGTTPDDSTPSFTLEELRNRNGNGTPFILPSDSVPAENARVQAEQKLCGLEEEIRALRVEHADVLRVRERMEEQKAAAAAATKTNKDRAAPGITPNARSRTQSMEVIKWAKEASEFFVHVFRCFNGEAELFIEEEYFLYHEDLVRKLKAEGNIVAQELFRRFKEEGFFFCSFCDRFMFTFGHVCMHIGNLEHYNKVSAVSSSYQRMNHIVVEMVDKERIRALYESETLMMNMQADRYTTMSLDDPELRPTREFIDESNRPFFLNTFPDEFLDEKNRPFLLNEKGRVSKVEFALQLVSDFTANPDVVDILLAELIQHIGKAKTRCFSCQLIFSNAVEYFRHLISFLHIQEVGTYDSITFTVNMHLTRMEKLSGY
ncbi:hypothetical protein PMAYCL1PPCAC_01276 [Pristionchus mayeri]|uniref:GYF domain-containing protein n=1 Tax=Pristionchus mayeri TaxID=1317129 RepID=A0AAN4YZF7_9BILA|nr:hypothetical protein PMAYCL1PPCAC_01276 [Pristionchus mayeri]